MSEWINAPESPMDHFGFVYKITHTDSGAYYIGKKQFKRRIRRQPLKGKKRRRIDWVESNWKDYWGSSGNLLEAVGKHGERAFRREILAVCESKSEMAYRELAYQISHDVLADKRSFNGIINVRLSRPVGDPISEAMRSRVNGCD